MLATVLAGSLAAVTLTAAYDFERGKAERPPTGFEFTTGSGAPAARWVVKKDGEGLVLAQVEDKAEERFASAVVRGKPLKDLRASVRVKTLGGYQGAGLVWRYQGPDDYYVARINPDEKNVRVDAVVKGKRTKLGSAPVETLKTGAWHTLAVEQRGGKLAVTVDGARLIEAEDGTWPDAGRVGLWTKDDTVAHFDDLTFEALR